MAGSRAYARSRGLFDGWVILVVALLSPIATMSEWLFSVHMQHELLMLVAAPLITLGRPLVPMVWRAAGSLEDAAQRRRRLVATVGQFIEDRRLIQRREVPDP